MAKLAARDKHTGRGKRCKQKLAKRKLKLGKNGQAGTTREAKEQCWQTKPTAREKQECGERS